MFPVASDFLHHSQGADTPSYSLASCLLPATQDWGSELFEALKAAGGHAYSNYAVGYNNVKVPEATKRGIPVGNTPGGKQERCTGRVSISQ